MSAVASDAPSSAAQPHHGESAASPRPPTSVLVVDANIILSVVLGRRSRPVFEQVIASRTVVTSARAADEVRGVLREIRGLPPTLPNSPRHFWAASSS